MNNSTKLKEVFDSLDLAVMSVQLENQYGFDPFAGAIPLTFGDLRKQLIITRDKPTFKKIWDAYSRQEAIKCYTSGTTGEPKSVSHPYSFWQKHIRPGSPNDIWGLCYDPDHIAGIFVILQAFANNSSLVYLWNHPDPGEEIHQNRITHLSASPTFYRMLEGDVFPLVKSVTIGSGSPLTDLSTMFPNAKIRNIYATTEHGVIATSNDVVFELKENMKIFQGELYVDDKPTGDQVEFTVDEGKSYFVIKGRKDGFANVGGEKVYFEYVERILLQNNPAIKAIKVAARPNSVTGEILFAEIELDDPDDLNPINFTGLKKFEIPIMQFVNNIAKTKTGKVKR